MMTGSGFLLVLASLHGQGFGIEDGQTTPAADMAALVMLGVIFFVTALIAAFAWTMRRRSRRPDPTLAFLDSLRNDSAPGESPDGNCSSTPLEAWERPPDWWKPG